MKETNKVVYITLADGRVFSVSGHEIAHNRAAYYAGCDEDTTYESEYEFTVNDKYALSDWLFNNMDWYGMETLHLKKTDLKPLQECEVVEVEVVEGDS